jgi:hypothetical protein
MSSHANVPVILKTKIIKKRECATKFDASCNHQSQSKRYNNRNSNIKNKFICHIASQQSLPICPSNHPITLSISSHHIKHIQNIYFSTPSNPDEKITSLTNNINPFVTYQSFFNLLSFGSPTDDSIFHSFCTFLRNSNPDCYTLDTNFHRCFMSHGWTPAFNKFFLHTHSSNYAKKQRTKPTIESPSILIPIHVNTCHWVALVRRLINNTVYFLYSDDMNLHDVRDTI